MIPPTLNKMDDVDATCYLHTFQLTGCTVSGRKRKTALFVSRKRIAESQT